MSDLRGLRLGTRATGWMVALLLAGCGARLMVTGGPQWSNRPSGPTTMEPASPTPGGPRRSVSPTERAALADYESLRQSYEDMTYAALADKLKLRPAPDASSPFDPTRADYYGLVRERMKLSAAEAAAYRKKGVVVVDHGEIQSMASAYLAIYTADLPVLITSDSILHAMHRSFDAILMELELGQFVSLLERALDSMHQALAAEWRSSTVSALEESARDVDLYLTVARALLEPDAPKPFTSVFLQDVDSKKILSAIQSLTLQQDFPLYGGQRSIDFSQLKPRGHYTKDPKLERYFRAMMWLGRVDLGFYFPLLRDGAHRHAMRELRDASLLTLVLSKSGALDALTSLNRAIQFFVGDSDNAGPADVSLALASAGIKEIADLASDDAMKSVAAQLAKSGVPHQRIRSQVLQSPGGNSDEIALPDVFQLMGQRFVIDSFVLSKHVFDSIRYQGERQERFMPSGLDIMAAFGNDEAVALLEPELERYKYAANLLASRTFVERQSAETWNANAYNVWLSALSKLDDVPEGSAFPIVMRTHAWQMKQLQTQLASWAELRHDTILYAKQSFTAQAICEYPTGYVEPYPAAFSRMAAFAELAKTRLEAAKLAFGPLSGFLVYFAETARRLERLAQKELRAQPFDRDDRKFVKDTISIQWDKGGCAGPIKTYSGWYPQLLYGSEPETWEPTVADVHTNPNDGKILEEGVGSANFLVVAIDNAGDLATYVGPIYSYYEFASGERLSDPEWQAKIEGKALPARPDWTHAFMP